MNATNIEWVKNPDGSQGYTLNPMSGCKNHTPEGLCLDGLFPCYAWKLAHGRLKSRYLANPNIAIPEGIKARDLHDLSPELKRQYSTDPFYPRFWEERLGQIPLFGQARGIFVCDMGDLFGEAIPSQWTHRILNHIGECQRHRFYLLTKQPQNLIKWSPFPENCWVGVTVTNMLQRQTAISHLNSIIAPVRFLSCEPLLAPLNATGWQSLLGINWLIIGACTGTCNEMYRLRDTHVGVTPMAMPLCYTVNNRREGFITKWTAQPNIEWVQEIVEAADKAGTKVFLKDNLMPLFKRGDIWAIPEWAGFNDWAKQDIGTTLRQEMPVEL